MLRFDEIHIRAENGEELKTLNFEPQDLIAIQTPKGEILAGCYAEELSPGMLTRFLTFDVNNINHVVPLTIGQKWPNDPNSANYTAMVLKTTIRAIKLAIRTLDAVGFINWDEQN